MPRATTKVAQEPAVLIKRALAGEDLYESVVRERHYQEASSEQQAAMDQVAVNSARKSSKMKKEKERAEKAAAAAALESTAAAAVSTKGQLPAVAALTEGAVEMEVPDDDLYGDMGDMGGGDDDLYGDLDDGDAEDIADAAGAADAPASAAADITATGRALEEMDVALTNDATGTAAGAGGGTGPGVVGASGDIQRTETGLLGDALTGAYPLPQSVSEHYGQNTSTGRFRLINGGLQGRCFATLFLETLAEAKAVIGV